MGKVLATRAIASAILAVALQCEPTAVANDQNSQCLHVINLNANQKVRIATLVQNDGGLYSSKVINFAGRVRTEDGSNKFKEVWIKHQDLVRWGTNEDIDARGPVFNFRKRMGFVGKGMSEIRVRTLNSPTSVCLCTERDMDKQDPSYPARHAACIAFITK